MTDLLSKKCVPCEGGVPPLTADQIAEYLPQVPGWEVQGDKKISREFTFKNFVKAVDFINAVADIAEEENHHPDLFLHDYKNVHAVLRTHAIGGLSENDFIVAARINRMAAAMFP